MNTTPEYARLKHDTKDGYDLNKLDAAIASAAPSSLSAEPEKRTMLQRFRAGEAIDMMYHGTRKRVDSMQYQRPGFIRAGSGRMLPVIFREDGTYSGNAPMWLEVAPTAQAPAIQASEAVVTDEMVMAYLKANDEYWLRTDRLPRPADKWRNGTPQEATRESLIAALAATPSAAVSAEPVDVEHWLALATKLRGMTYTTIRFPDIRDAAKYLEDAYMAVRATPAPAPTQPQQGTAQGEE